MDFSNHPKVAAFIKKNKKDESPRERNIRFLKMAEQMNELAEKEGLTNRETIAFYNEVFPCSPRYARMFRHVANGSEKVKASVMDGSVSIYEAEKLYDLSDSKATKAIDSILKEKGSHKKKQALNLQEEISAKKMMTK